MVNITMHKALPGFASAAVGFEAPFDMLEACHERVERMLVLLKRLCRHLQDKGCDEQAHQAARDVVRYFDVAAPLHHQDEELHVFPRLLDGPDAAAAEGARVLLAQHRQLEVRWAEMRAVLLTLTDLRSEHVDTFVQAYRTHIQLEESLAYPAAKQQLDALQIHDMGEEMMVRRGVTRIIGH